jgi:hypothetical protein
MPITWNYEIMEKFVIMNILVVQVYHHNNYAIAKVCIDEN